jgi:hypothetical protein
MSRFDILKNRKLKKKSEVELSSLSTSITGENTLSQLVGYNGVTETIGNIGISTETQAALSVKRRVIAAIGQKEYYNRIRQTIKEYLVENYRELH